MARDYTQAVGGIQFCKLGDGNVTAGAFGQATNGILLMQNPTDNKIYIAPFRIMTIATNQTLRGRMRGFWHFLHPIASVSDGDTFSGVGDLAGKSFMMVKQGGNAGVWCIETSNTWDAN